MVQAVVNVSLQDFGIRHNWDFCALPTRSRNIMGERLRVGGTEVLLRWCRDGKHSHVEFFRVDF